MADEEEDHATEQEHELGLHVAELDADVEAVQQEEESQGLQKLCDVVHGTPSFGRSIDERDRSLQRRAQQGPDGIVWPWGQELGWPRKAQIESVMSGERMCSK